MVKYILAAVLVASGGAGVGLAQDGPVCFEPVMVPIIAHRVPGAAGSLWQTRLAITNHSAVPVQINGHGECRLNPCPPPRPIAPESTIFPRVYTPYLRVQCGRLSDVMFQLRIQDLSRQSETWGTTIPLVRESDVFENEVISIIDIPNSADFRSMLRIYGFDPGLEGIARIRLFALDEDVDDGGIGDEFLLELTKHVQAQPSAPQHRPTYVEISLWMLPELSNKTRIRLEIEGDSDLRLWAFVSATNNNTQHVTVLLPQRAPVVN